MCSFSLGDQQSTWLLADRVLDDGNVSGYHFLLTSEFICCWIFCNEGIRVQLDEDQIMKVIYLRKQTKNSRIYSLVLFRTTFTKPHEKPWKECINPIALSPKLDSTFLHLRVRPKFHLFLSAFQIDVSKSGILFVLVFLKNFGKKVCHYFSFYQHHLHFVLTDVFSF